MSRARGSRLGAGRVVRMRAGSPRRGGVAVLPVVDAPPVSEPAIARPAAPVLPPVAVAEREAEPA